MLKPMKTKRTYPNNTILWVLVGVLVISGIVALVMAFRGNDSGEDEVNAVYTNAAATLAAQQLTLQASAPSSTPTIFASPTVTFTVFASPTLFTQPQLSTNTPSGSSGAVGCNNSVFVVDITIDDDTIVAPGQAMTKTWRLQNTGSCPWTPTYKVSFVSGDAMSGVATPIGVTVQPGQPGDISVTMTAPTTPGTVTGTWILTDDSGQNFGSTFYIRVVVGGTAATGTATVTGVAVTATATTPAPTDTPTETPSPTSVP